MLAPDQSRSPERLTDPRQIALVLITHYPSDNQVADARMLLAQKTIVTTLDSRYQVIVADTQQSRPSFKDFLARQANRGLIVVPRQGLDRTLGTLAAIQAASQIRKIQAIITSQPEKNLIQDNALATIAQPLLENKADVVIARREPELFASSYPKYMWESEQKANAEINKIIRKYLGISYPEDYDIFFGVMGYRNDPNLLDTLLEPNEYSRRGETGIDRHAGQDFVLTPWVRALFEPNIRVLSVTVPFVYAEKQRENEMDPQFVKAFLDKRRQQRFGIMLEIIHTIRQLRAYKFRRPSRLVRLPVERQIFNLKPQS